VILSHVVSGANNSNFAFEWDIIGDVEYVYWAS
jgi:hypothetical protein